MKYNIVFKFLAVALCALFLLGSVGSGLGILALTESELYERTVDEVYDEAIADLSNAFAGQVASQWAGKELGGCPEVILGGYGLFTDGYYGYALKDASGNVLKQKKLPDYSGARYATFDLTGREYMKIISVSPAEDLNPTEPPEAHVYNALTKHFAQVQSIDVTYLESGISESASTDGMLGMLYLQEDGTVVFQGLQNHYPLSETGLLTMISFYGTDGTLLYQISSSDAVGHIYAGENNVMEFASFLPSEAEDSTIPVVPAEPDYLYNAIPYEGVEVQRVELTYLVMDGEAGGSDSFTGDGVLGKLITNGDGTVSFIESTPHSISPKRATVSYAAFYGMDGELLYETYCPGGAGQINADNGYVHFQSWLEAEGVPNSFDGEIPNTTAPATEPEPTPAVTEVPTEAPMADPASIIAEVTDPTEAPVAVADSFSTYYWDAELQQNMLAEYVYEKLPEGYTFELWLLPGAFEMDPLYDLLQFVWRYRNELFFVLGVSALLFAVFAVYLCCGAGRKPGREEIRADGLNRLPLDLYLTAGGFTIYGLAILTFEGAYYLLKNSPHVIAHYIIIAGYLAALIIVGFSFACAAQFKTPGGFWWKNSICGRAFRLLLAFGGWLERFLGTKCFPFLGRSIRFCWRSSKKLCVLAYRYTEKFLTWLVRFTVRWIKRLWKYGTLVAVTGFRWLNAALRWLGKGLGKIAQRTYAWLHAFLSLLPVTWQWLLVGFGMLLLMVITVNANNEEILVLLCGGICIAIILYASHCFGILWDSTKKMSKGDLETKVDDKLMIGAFKDFASDLNALADVAVVAAQKQLKSERMKTELITNVSHDIKTPLTSIINYVDFLQKPHSDEDQEVYLEVLARQSQQMKKLLEDLIEMSKANTGNMPVYLTPLNAAEAINQALGEFSDKLDAAQLIPVIRQPEEDVLMQADGRLLWRVLSNLLSNVVKYALPGTRVYIELAKEGEKVRISVKNISREALNIHADELMERFVRGDASRNTEGSGLGLNIAQSLMEIQKGKLDITVDGDLFKVTLTFPAASE